MRAVASVSSRGVLHDLGAAAALAGDLVAAPRVDPRVDRLRLRRVDRDRVDERVAAQQRRSHLAQRGVARRVGAVGDHQQRGALARALRRASAARRRSRRRSRCRRTAAAPRARAARRPASRVHAGQRPRPVVERHQEELVGRIEQLEQEPLDRGARVLDPPAEHAVADVEQHAEADRHALAGELRDRLRRRRPRRPRTPRAAAR